MKPLLTSLTVKGELAERVKCRKKEFTFEAGTNLLVGPNGSGKSTILSIFRTALKDDKTKETLTSVYKDQPKELARRLAEEQEKIEYSFDLELCNVFMFDFEKDNFRTKGNFDRAVGFHVSSLYSSHGETNKAIIGALKDEGRAGALYILDEPEQALDLEGLDMLLEGLRTTKAQQVLIATHSPTLILQPDFHLIELEEGYVEKIREHTRALIRSNT